MADFIVLGLLGTAVFFVLRYRMKNGKEVNCGCGRTSEGCKSCKKRNGK